MGDTSGLIHASCTKSSLGTDQEYALPPAATLLVLQIPLTVPKIGKGEPPNIDFRMNFFPTWGSDRENRESRFFGQPLPKLDIKRVRTYVLIAQPMPCTACRELVRW